MGKFWEEIPENRKLVDWIREQKLFHVATAPLNGGHVNVSPKGYQSFKLVNRRACWYLDLTGSGNETISHLYEPGNGRITIMFEAFEGPPQIVRLYGKGRVYEKGTPEFEKFFEPSDEPEMYDFPTPELMPGARSVIWVDIDLVSTSCGYSVPFMTYERDRDQLNKEAARAESRDDSAEDPYSLPITKPGMTMFQLLLNTWSVDGLPGLKHHHDKVTPEIVQKGMTVVGLKPPRAAHVTAGAKELQMILVGLLLGVVTTLSALRAPSLLSFVHQ